MKNKTKHFISGYYGTVPYSEVDSIVVAAEDASQRRLDGNVLLDTATKTLDTPK